MTTVNIGNIDNPYFIQFDKVTDPADNKASYIVKWYDDNEFVITQQQNAVLAITGVAPYEARVQEDRIIEAIAESDKLAA